MPNDPKWRTISRISKQSIPAVMAVYIHLLVGASNASERGRTQNVCTEDIASALDLETEQVDAIVAAMQGRVLDGDRVSGWEKRQPEREDGASERARAWRVAKKSQSTTEKQADQTPVETRERSRTQPNAIKRSEHKPNADERSEKRREEESREEVLTHTTSALPREPDDEPQRATKAGAVCVVLKSEGVSRVNPSHPELIALIGQGAEVGQFSAAAKLAVSKQKPNFAYVLGIVRRQLEDAEKTASNRLIRDGPAPPQPETFRQRDARDARARWEQMTGQTHPDNLPAAMPATTEVLEILQ